MELNLKDKVVAITGGAGGIGTAVALEFAGEGAKVAVCDFSDDNLNALAEKFRERGYTLYTENIDVREPDQLERFADNTAAALGGLDVWINNAGVNRVKPFLEVTPEDYQVVVDTGMKHVFWGTRAAAKHMIKTGGVVINTASYSGIMPTSRTVPYSASKAGVLNLTKATAGSLAPYGIRVNCVVPGAVRTPLTAARLAAHMAGKLDPAITSIALQRVSEPEELAKLYTFLASDASSYINGEAIEISGGKNCVQDVYRVWEDSKQA